jgi:hypothetical protein
MDRTDFYLFISGYFAAVLGVLGALVLILDANERWASIPLFVGAAVFAALWLVGRKAR